MVDIVDITHPGPGPGTCLPWPSCRAPAGTGQTP